MAVLESRTVIHEITFSVSTDLDFISCVGWMEGGVLIELINTSVYNFVFCMNSCILQMLAVVFILLCSLITAHDQLSTCCKVLVKMMLKLAKDL